MRKAVVWISSVSVALVLFGAFTYWEASSSNTSQVKGTINKVAEKLASTPLPDEPGKITQFEISIKKIGVMAPVIPNVDASSKNLYNQALKDGVAHFKGSALPSAGSNIFIFGHSSSVFGAGKYDRIFANLNKLLVGDTVSLFYNGKEYAYKVTEKKIISASNTSSLEPTDNEQLTLMTCWPIGTAQKRLIVIAVPVN